MTASEPPPMSVLNFGDWASSALQLEMAQSDYEHWTRQNTGQNPVHAAAKRTENVDAHFWIIQGHRFLVYVVKERPNPYHGVKGNSAVGVTEAPRVG